MSGGVNLTIVTPEQILFQGAVEWVQVPLHDGMIGVWPGHAPLIAAISAGTAQYRADEQTIEELQKLVQDDPRTDFHLDLEAQTLSHGEKSIPIDISPAAKTALLAGTWNTLDELLQNEAAIEEVHRRLPTFV